MIGFDKTTGLAFWTANGGPQDERQNAASQSIDMYMPDIKTPLT
ncbi:hypothetical protein Q7O_001376 [Pectobacterium carotovorum subsp. carotovorum PCCS1]|nr:hypothetical protein [Pectobacterium carotovorum]MBG0751930.1 hypothetical protein [Pectobacterium carotovorum subsp. carotovorum PCCS1]